MAINVKRFGLIPGVKPAATRSLAKALGVDLKARFETREQAQTAAELATMRLGVAIFVSEDHEVSAPQAVSFTRPRKGGSYVVGISGKGYMGFAQAVRAAAKLMGVPFDDVIVRNEGTPESPEYVVRRKA